MTDVTARLPARDIRVIGLVGAGHYCSHFFQLALPPLFPVLKDEFGVGYAELGLGMTVFYAMSGLMQTPAGFMVDRFGPRRILLVGLAVLSSGIALMTVIPGYWAMVIILALAGLGNSVFHPADYSILTARVGKERLARAYSVHTLGGNLGWATAPAVVLGLAAVYGSWRPALLTVGLTGLAVTLCLALSADLGRDERHRPAVRNAPVTRADISVLASLPVVLCFAYFALLASSLIGIQNFMPAALNLLYGTPLTVASAALTTFLFGGTVGVVAGGILADRWHRHEIIVALGLLTAGALVFLVGSIELNPLGLTAALAVAGLALNCTIPSRDMLVRSATPPGATGKVFGFVYSGLDLGAATGPALLGLMLDRGHPRGVFVFVAVLVCATVGAALLVRRAAPRPAVLPRPAE